MVEWNFGIFAISSQSPRRSTSPVRLGIKQPPLRLQIRQLEREMGTSLFRRLTRGVELTGSGTTLLDKARRILDQAERTKAHV